ncbi:MAG: exo-alpha-sialidase, partial [Xanthomonadaceae bacterium]|nr:exo-alpha-sialidase [Xanthomonadaceae bacterium]
DPWVSYSPNGVVHAMALSTNGGVFQVGSVNAMLASRSFDHGRTWSNPIALIRDSAAAFNDKNALTADPNDANFVYAVWDRLIDANDSGPAYFARSVDGGASWEPARPIHDPGSRNQTIGNQIVVLPNGVVVDVFNQIDRPTLGPQRSRVGIVRSFDRGATWSAPIYIADLLAVGTTDPWTGVKVRDGSIIPSIAVSPLGELYAVWQDARFGNGAHDAIAMSRSIDSGATWSAPIRVNAIVGAAAFTPSVSVGRNGVVAVSYYDLRNDTATPALTADVWLARSGDGGATWTEQRIGASFDLSFAPNANGYFVGDYQGLIEADGVFVAFYGKANDGDLENRTDIVSAPLPHLPPVSVGPASAAAKRQAQRSRGAPTGFEIGPRLRQRVDSNLRRRLREPPSANAVPRVLPHDFATVIPKM